MAFTLTIEILLAQIGMPAVEHQTQKVQLIFFA